MEGSEPQFFTRFFTWDLTKSAVSKIPCNYKFYHVQIIEKVSNEFTL